MQLSSQQLYYKLSSTYSSHLRGITCLVIGKTKGNIEIFFCLDKNAQITKELVEMLFIWLKANLTSTSNWQLGHATIMVNVADKLVRFILQFL